jgi:hypothetical protein
VSATVSDGGALGESAVDQHVLCSRSYLAQGLSQSRCPAGQQHHDGTGVSVSSADADPESGRDPGASGALTQVHERDQRTRGRAERAPAVTTTKDDQHRDGLHEGMRKIDYGRVGNQ